MPPTQGVGGSGGCAGPGTNEMGLSLQPGLFLKNVVAKLAEGSSVRSSHPRKQHREALPADRILYGKGSNTWAMQPCASKCARVKHTCQSLHPTQKPSLLFVLPGLAGNDSFKRAVT